ncbi:MAG: putative molybdenum carrier protein [Flavobacteriales bacterium]
MKLTIISGGQTGVDRAALDFALENGLECGGYCPKGRLAEDGEIPDCYPLTETASAKYEERTILNVLHSDATLIINPGSLMQGGTAFTFEQAKEAARPCLVADCMRPMAETAIEVMAWLKAEDICILNVAGPRESGFPGIYLMAKEVLNAALPPVLHSSNSTK